MTGVRFRMQVAIFVLVTALFIAPLAIITAQSKRSATIPNQSQDYSKLGATRLNQISATVGPEGVLIEWRTSYEIDNAGFNVYRVRDGQTLQINRAIIAGSALLAGPGRPLYAGHGYSWFDPQGTANDSYFVEEVDLTGQRTAHDAVRPVWGSKLMQLGLSPATFTETSSIQPALHEWPGAQAPAPPAPSDALSDQWNLIASVPSLKVAVKAEGWYRVTQPQMAAAGFDLSRDAHNLRMFVGARETPIRVSRDTATLNASDYIEFYGLGLDQTTTDTQIYYLVNGAQAGLRIPISGELNPNNTSAIQPSARSGNKDDRAATASGIVLGAGVSAEEVSSEKGKSPAVPANDGSPAVTPVVNAPRPNRDASEVKDPIIRNDSGKAIKESGAARPATSPRLVISSSTNGAKSAVRSKHSTRAAALRGSAKMRHRRDLRRRSNRLNRRHHDHATPSIAAAPQYFSNTVQRKDRSVYFSALLNGDTENFFGDIVNGSTPAKEVLTLHNLETSAAGPAQLTVAMQGVSSTTQEITVAVNGVQVGSMTFFYQDHQVQTFPVPISALVEGDNVVKLSSGSTTSLVDYTQITFPRSFKAFNDSLRFNLRYTQSARIDGFTDPNARIIDVTDPMAVKEVRPIVEASGSGYALTVPVAGPPKKGSRTLFAFPSNQPSQPASITLNQPSTLNASTNGATLLIISYKDFIPSLAPLIAQRQSRDGFTVAVADIEDVFDEFSYGVHTPQAISDFFARARSNWATKPQYIILMGDATYDPRNYEGRPGNFDLVPTRLIDTNFGETASDDFLLDLDGDGIADVPVGRMPARTATEANLMISKIVNFTPPSPQTAIMVADSNFDYYFDFEQANEDLGASLPNSMSIRRVYRPSCNPPYASYCAPDDATAHQDLVNEFNAGPALVTYSGHGNTNFWRGSIFSSNDAFNLTNGNKLPLVIVNDCLNGYFISTNETPPGNMGIAEALLKAPNGGAVASFASSGETIPDGQQQMATQLYKLLYGPQSISIGDAVVQAKTATTDIDVKRTWILFGDPTMKIR
jgi:Peptidase family C25